MAAAGANEVEQEAAGREAPPPLLDPHLFMAARRGDSKQLKDLLQLEDEEEEEQQDTEEQVESRSSPAAAAAPAAAAQDDDDDIRVDVDPVPADTVAVERQQQQLAAASAAAAQDDDDDIRVDVDPMPDGAAGQQHQPAAAPAPPPVQALDGGGVTMEGDSLLHVVAACGDGDDFIKCAKMIVRDKERKGGVGAKRQVLQARNSKGDTPLHCAAGAGHAGMISCLVALAADTDMMKALVRMQNQCGETPLHQAVRAANNKEACIDQLMSVDPGLACIPPDDTEEEGASPLYLAISLGELEVARHLFDTTRGNLSYSGPDGRNVLHAAVSRGQALPMVLHWLKKRKRKELKTVGMQVERHADLPLQQLTSQRDKQADGSSPLHLAAALSGWPSGRFLAKWFPQVWTWSVSATELLLDANESAAYQPDDRGSYPIHVAALAGNLGAVFELLRRCPDCATLRDGQGRTFLHVASESAEDGVVEYACGIAKFSSILNAQDKNGDTALHKAVRAGNLAAFNCLFRNRQVRLDVPNNLALTPLDLSWSMKPPREFEHRMNPRDTIQESLENAGAPHGGSRSDLFRRKHVARVDEDKASETYKDSTQAMGIVSVLIATVTFASAFTLPGGYRSDDGTPVLAGVYAFDAFILADTLAFLCSSLSTFSIVYAGIPARHHSIRLKYIQFATFLLHGAGRSFVTAFGLGLYLVLAPVHQAAAAAVCVITFASLLYGNAEAWQYLGILNTLRLRLGTIRIPAARAHVGVSIIGLLIYCWSLIIIFGLPAIFKWARK